MDGQPRSSDDSRTRLRELAWLFFRLGATGFGGPAAHIALMQDEVVTRRRWLSSEQFLDLLGAANLIPGPSSTELAIHIGWARRRWAGLWIAGSAFILPAMLITGALGFAYVRYGALPAASAMLYGIKPIVLAVVVQAIRLLLPRAAKTPSLRVLGALSIVLTLLGVDELLVLFGSGVLAIALALPGLRGSRGALLVLAPIASGVPALAGASGVSASSLFWVFLKIGSVLFGSGYVLLAFLRAELVTRLGWLTEAQVIDAIAVGQVTPGPVFTTATFIGYVLSGTSGALAATAGIFLPAFVFVALSSPFLPRLRASNRAGAFLDGVNVASLALMVVVTLRLGRAGLVDAPTVVLGAGALLLLLRTRINPSWLVLAGALIGLALEQLRGL